MCLSCGERRERRWRMASGSFLPIPTPPPLSDPLHTTNRLTLEFWKSWLLAKEGKMGEFFEKQSKAPEKVRAFHFNAFKGCSF